MNRKNIVQVSYDDIAEGDDNHMLEIIQTFITIIGLMSKMLVMMRMKWYKDKQEQQNNHRYHTNNDGNNLYSTKNSSNNPTV